MRIFIALGLAGLYLSSIPANAPAQDNGGNVTVIVSDHYTIQPLLGAQVSVWRDGELVSLGTTDQEGKAILQLTDVGTTSEIPDRLHISPNYPNPFSGRTRIDVTSPGHEPIQYEVFNLLGQRVFSDGAELRPGRQSIDLPLAHLSAGVYFLRVNGSVSTTLRLVKVGAGTAEAPVAAETLPTAERVTIRPQSLPLEGAYTLRVKRDRYATLEFAADLTAGMELDVYVERLNRAAFLVWDQEKGQAPPALQIQERDSTIVFSALDTLILRSGTYVVSSPAGAAVAIHSRIELPSVDTTFVLRSDSPATATVSGVVSNTLDERMSGIPVRAFHREQLVSETHTNAEGAYTLTIPADGRRVSLVADAQPAHVAEFDPETFISYSRALEVLDPHPGLDYTVHFVLRPEWPLTVAGGNPDTLEIPLALSTPGGSVIIADIPRELDIVAGSARAYSPTIDGDAFPGEFATREDGAESGLLSGGFVSVNLLRQNGAGLEPVRELRNGNGDPVFVQLRFRIAREDWHVIQDAAHFSVLPGYVERPDTLSAPLYYYDELRGDWVLNDTFGWLEDINGAVPPAAVGQIQDGTYPSELYMVGLVNHFTVYNLDYPHPHVACFTGRLIDQDWNPVAGKKLTFYSPPETQAFSFFSNKETAVTTATGHFHVRVPRTELNLEDDWNNNNKVDNFRAFARYEDKNACGLTIFDNNGAGYPTPTFAEDPHGCRNLGVLRVELKQARRRTIDVTFLDIVREGQPNYPLFASPPSMAGMNHAFGTLFDNRVPVGGDIWQCVCDGTIIDFACNYQATTNAGGTARFRIPVLDRDEFLPEVVVDLVGSFSYRKTRQDLGEGAYEFAGCNYLVPENQTSRTTRCEVERRGPPEIEIVEPAPTDSVNGVPVYHFLYDDPITLAATGTDVNGNSIDHLNMFYWTRPGVAGTLNGRTHAMTAAAAFGTGEGRSISVTGIDFFGWLGSASLGGVRVEPVEVSIEPDSVQLVPGRSETLVATVTGANNTAVTWTSGNASVATVDADGVVTAVNPGEATITARSAADPTKTATAVVQVANLVPRFTVSPPLGDSTTVFTFDASSSTGDIVSYSWDFGDGNTASGEVTTHQYTQSLDYTVTLTVTDVDGLTADIQRTVIASGGVLASFTATPQSGAPPLIVEFDASGSQAFGATIVSWTWDFGDGQSGTGETISHTYHDPGTYLARLTAEDDRGRTGTDSLEIRVNAPPVASFTVSPEFGAAPLEVTVNAAASTAPAGQIIRYGWDFGDGTVIEDGGVVETHTYVEDGEFVITLTVEDNDGSTDSTTRAVSVGCADVHVGNVFATSLEDLIMLIGTCRVEGQLFISGPDIAHLNPLQSLTSVSGGLVITNNPSLDNLDGLSSLRSAGGLTVSSNAVLVSIDGLGGLERVDGNLVITNNGLLPQCDALTLDGVLRRRAGIQGTSTVSGNNTSQGVAGFVTINSAADMALLDGICDITGNLSINNTTLTDLSGAESLLRVGGTVTISGNNSLTSLTGLDNVFRIRILSLMNNHTLTDLTGLSGLHSAFRVSINANNNMQSLAGLEGLRVVEETLSISQLPELQNTDALSNLQQVTNFAIHSSPKLQSINAQGLTVVPGYINLTQLPALESLEGLSNLTEVRDRLILSFLNLTNLNGLGNLRSVRREIQIGNLPNLTTLAALDALEELGGLHISNSPGFTTFDGFNLQSLGGTLQLMNNAGLEDLNGLESLRVIEGDVIIANNPNLTSLSGLQGLEEIRLRLRVIGNPLLEDIGALANLRRIDSEILFSSNPALVSLAPLSNLQNFTDALEIQHMAALTELPQLETTQLRFLTIANNASLPSLAGLDQVETVQQTLRIASNAALANLDGLGGLRRVNASLFIEQNNALATLSGLNSLERVGGSFQITDSPALASMAALESLDEVQSLALARLPLLQDLTGFEKLTALAGLQLTQNDGLTSLNGLNNVTEIRNFNLSHLPQLADFTGLDKLDSLDFVTVHNMAALKDFGGMPALRKIEWNVNLSDNPALESLRGLEQIETVRELTVSRNNALEDLTGLDNLIEIRGSLTIQQNGGMTTLNGLENLERVDSQFRIQNNTSLPECLAEALRDQVQGRRGIGGAIFISGNDAGAVCE